LHDAGDVLDGVADFRVVAVACAIERCADFDGFRVGVWSY
jgi:hypothetical protein